LFIPPRWSGDVIIIIIAVVASVSQSSIIRRYFLQVSFLFYFPQNVYLIAHLYYYMILQKVEHGYNLSLRENNKLHLSTQIVWKCKRVVREFQMCLYLIQCFRIKCQNKIYLLVLYYDVKPTLVFNERLTIFHKKKK